MSLPPSLILYSKLNVELRLSEILRMCHCRKWKSNRYESWLGKSGKSLLQLGKKGAAKLEKVCMPLV
jgi:hypothetical protein